MALMISSQLYSKSRVICEKSVITSQYSTRVGKFVRDRGLPIGEVINEKLRLLESEWKTVKITSQPTIAMGGPSYTSHKNFLAPATTYSLICVTADLEGKKN